MTLLEIHGLEKSFYDADGNCAAKISVKSLSLNRGEMLILEGPSGSGKTTVLHLISGLLKQDKGQIIFDGKEISSLPAKERDRFRAKNIGYIFQKLNLLDALTVEENIIIAAKWTGETVKNAHEYARKLLDYVGLANKARMRPARLSLGEQQRIAILRAVFNKPSLLLADEPTASLDRANADKVLKLLKDLCAETGAALLLSTHDEYVKDQFGRRYNMRTGEFRE